jgi:hypothetical protein
MIKQSSIKSETGNPMQSNISETFGTNSNMDQFQSNNLSQFKSMNLAHENPPTKEAKQVYVDLINCLSENPIWLNKNKIPSVQIKLFGNNIKRINKFKFEIRKKLKKEHFLIIVHNKPTILNFVCTLQLSEKIEPDSLWDFLKTSGLISTQKEKPLYKSKDELKGKEKVKDTLKQEIRRKINDYFVESWIKKNNILDPLTDETLKIIKERLKEIDKSSEVQEGSKFVNKSEILNDKKGIVVFMYNK